MINLSKKKKLQFMNKLNQFVNHVMKKNFLSYDNNFQLENVIHFGKI